MSPRKLTFLIVALIALVSIALGGYVIAQYTKKQKVSLEGGRIDMWVVGEDKSGYDPLIQDFKKTRPQYAQTDVVITKFLTQADYEKNLISAFSDDRAPDIFMVPSVGGDYLENKVTALPPDLVSVDRLSLAYHPKVLSDLTITGTQKDANGKSVTVLAMKGVSMGYESLGLYYNSALFSRVPTTLAELERLSREENSESYPLGFLLDQKTPYVSQIVTHALASYGVKGYTGMTSREALGVFDRLRAFDKSTISEETQRQSSLDAEQISEDEISGGTAYSSSKTVTTLREEVEAGDTKRNKLTDLFALGKVGMLIGPPRLMLDIQLAIKGAGEANTLMVSNFATAKLPQFGPKDESSLFYSYLALSRDTDNPTGAMDLLSYLTTPEAQKLYSESFPYMISVNKNIATQQATKTLVSAYPRTRFAAFIPKESGLISFDPGLFLEYQLGMNRVISSSDIALSLEKLTQYISCQRSQLISLAGFESVCSLNIP